MGSGKTYQSIIAAAANPLPKTLFIVQNNNKAAFCDALLRITKKSPLVISTKFKCVSIPEDTHYVVTTYSVFNYNGVGKKGEGNFPIALAKCNWNRVVCDEAHELRGDKTLKSKNISSLKYDIFWGMTATPIHNNIKDLTNLIKLIGPIDTTDIEEVKKKYILCRTNNEIAINNPRLAHPGIRLIDLPVTFRYESEQETYDNIVAKYEDSGSSDKVLQTIIDRKQV